MAHAQPSTWSLEIFSFPVCSMWELPLYVLSGVGWHETRSRPLYFVVGCKAPQMLAMQLQAPFS
eukprot:5433230-Amphidinium_carterae.1